MFKEIIGRFVEENEIEEFRESTFKDPKEGDLFSRGLAYLEKYFTNSDILDHSDSKKNFTFYQNHLLNIYKNKFLKAITIFESIGEKYAEASSVVSDV